MIDHLNVRDLRAVHGHLDRDVALHAEGLTGVDIVQRTRNNLLGQLSSRITAGGGSPGDADTGARILTGEGIAGNQLAHAVEAVHRIAFAVDNLALLIDFDARDGVKVRRTAFST